MSLDLIEFHKTLSETSSANVNRVLPALENHGCFMATYENLKVCHETLEKKLPELFEASKKKLGQKRNGQYESFNIPEATTEKGIKKFITTIWPEGNEAMCRAIEGYTTTAAELEEMVRKIAPQHYSLPKESTGYIFHMMKHKKEVILGFPKSEDKFLAVLDLHQVNGLKMTTTDDNCFSIDVNPSTRFLIMAGKPLKDWKEVKIRGRHGNEEKYSVGLFSYRKEQVGSSSRS